MADYAQLLNLDKKPAQSPPPQKKAEVGQVPPPNATPFTQKHVQQEEKAPKHQGSKAPQQQAIKLLKHMSSYLTPESWKRLKMVATEREQHDYEILQNAVDLYFATLDKKEK